MRSKAKLRHMTLKAIAAAMLLTSGCSLLQPVPNERIVIMVKPGDPVWLIEDMQNVPVLVRGKAGEMKYGRATLRAGAVVWYDKKWNAETLKGADDGRRDAGHVEGD